MAKLYFVLGGARSGKSRYALKLGAELAKAKNTQPLFVATATAYDNEMKARIEKHQRERSKSTGAQWNLIEEPLALADVLKERCIADSVTVIDCLTLWISNCLHLKQWQDQQTELLNCLPSLQGTIIFVSNETGLGIVPLGELSRQYIDESGFFHQRLAELSDEVTFLVAGLPQTLKSSID